MGALWIAANLTKREYVNPHALGSGAKLGEWKCNPAASGLLLDLLGDSWLGDHVVLCNDSYQLTEVYELAHSEFADISAQAVEDWNEDATEEWQIKLPVRVHPDECCDFRAAIGG